MPRRMNGREHRDIDVAGAVAKELGRLLFAPGRDRVDVEQKRLAGKVRF
ncbi:MAG TPA: hypothetical protein VNW48_01790 [Xanthobacteraceae bacterium]|nr:hypothetical protein [Xanthobacteraceae bacterium]